MSSVVVGVDGSDESLAALRWAAEHARTHDATLTVVHAYGEAPRDLGRALGAVTPYGLSPVSGDIAASDPMGAGAAEQRRRVRVEQELDDWVEAAADALGDVSLHLQPLPEGPPAEALVRSASGADLLVVGSRGRGAVTGLLVGSVSQQVVNLATCPVVVVREDGDAERFAERTTG